MNEKSTTRQILTAGFSNSKSREYLKIEFSDAEGGKTENLILDVDYPLGTVYKNLEPILITASKRREKNPGEADELVIIKCSKCDSKNSQDSLFCSTCGEKIRVPVQSSVVEQRDYVVLKGEKTQEELKALVDAKLAEEYAKRLEKPDSVFNVKYVGGHKGFPTKKPRDARISIFVDRIEVTSDKFKVVIPYLQMTNIENMDERRITTKRWFLVGMWAIAWKKNFVYTVIEYEDEHDTLGLIFDFGKHLESKQGIIYQRMINARSNKSDKFGGFYQ
jgi:hypothetical protein